MAEFKRGPGGPRTRPPTNVQPPGKVFLFFYRTIDAHWKVLVSVYLILYMFTSHHNVSASCTLNFSIIPVWYRHSQRLL